MNEKKKIAISWKTKLQMLKAVSDITEDKGVPMSPVAERLTKIFAKDLAEIRQRKVDKELEAERIRRSTHDSLGEALRVIRQDIGL
jgi:hypothetical protein